MENIKPEVVAVDGEECVNMCIAFEEMIEEGRQEGREETLTNSIKAFIETFTEDGADKDYIIKKVMKIFVVAKESAENYYESCQNSMDMVMV